MSKYKKKIYQKPPRHGKPIRRLKDGRENIPEVRKRMMRREQTQDVKEWIQRADYWLNNRSRGFEDGKLLSREEIKQRKIEAGLLLQDFNRYFSDDELGKVKFR